MDNSYWINRFNEEALPLIRKQFNPAQIFVFGSRAKGQDSFSSDIDVIIVADAFKEIPFLKRMTFVLKLIKFPKHIDALCYTPEEFERIKLSSAIIQDAMQTARPLL